MLCETILKINNSSKNISSGCNILFAIRFLSEMGDISISSNKLGFCSSYWR